MNPGMMPMGPRPMHVNLPFSIPPMVNAAMGFLHYCDERKCPSWLAAWGQSDGVGGGVPDSVMERLNRLEMSKKDETVRQEALNVLYRYFSGEQNYIPDVPQGVKEMMAQGEGQAPNPMQHPASMGVLVGPDGQPIPLGELGVPPELLQNPGFLENMPQTPDEWIHFWVMMKKHGEGEDGDDNEG